LIRSAATWTNAFWGTEYWKTNKFKLIAMINQLCHLHLFTHSFADFHSADLREHLSKRLGVEVNPENQRTFVLNNPGLVNRFLYEKFTIIFKNFNITLPILLC
jgi:hypothetical protein